MAGARSAGWALRAPVFLCRLQKVGTLGGFLASCPYKRRSDLLFSQVEMAGIRTRSQKSVQSPDFFKGQAGIVHGVPGSLSCEYLSNSGHRPLSDALIHAVCAETGRRRSRRRPCFVARFIAIYLHKLDSCRGVPYCLSACGSHLRVRCLMRSVHLDNAREGRVPRYQKGVSDVFGYV